MLHVPTLPGTIRTNDQEMTLEKQNHHLRGLISLHRRVRLTLELTVKWWNLDVDLQLPVRYLEIAVTMSL